MYFNDDEFEEDGDDDLYEGVLKDKKLFTESSCDICSECEKRWGCVNTELHTKKQFKKEIQKYYENLIKSGTISMFVDLLASVYPKQLNNYLFLDHVMGMVSQTKNEHLKKKIQTLFELDEKISEEKIKLSMAIGKKQFTRELIEQVTERRKKAKLETEKGPVTESLLNLKKQLCEPQCSRQPSMVQNKNT
ncbi:uncharacterized protein LOC106670379 [Cimex lectularius]|uniref:Uncharacterized protein n=1 Tax=Cimex lectularius TaxID=79782 RepID=A0A8I6S3E0_CIMLE|nr:uncharacterized protein LOC106670379 [Cimex lectularius]